MQMLKSYSIENNLADMVTKEAKQINLISDSKFINYLIDFVLNNKKIKKDFDKFIKDNPEKFKRKNFVQLDTGK